MSLVLEEHTDSSNPTPRPSYMKAYKTSIKSSIPKKKKQKTTPHSYK